MKHATAEDLIPIAGLLDKIRREKRISERTFGIFYFRGKGFFALPPGSSRPANVDGRSAYARRFRDLVRAFEAEVGGTLSELERGLVRQAAASL